MPKADDRTCFIVGGGIGGLTAALCLAESGFRVEVFEQSHLDDRTGAGIQLSPNCTGVLIALGLETGLRAIASEPATAIVRDYRSGVVASCHSLNHYHFPYCHVHRADLMGLLAGAAGANASIKLHTNARIERIGQDARGVYLEHSGERLDASVLIGADGIHSRVRELIVPDAEARFTGHIAYRATVPATADPPPTGATLWWGPGRHFVHYPLRQGEVVNCVAVVGRSDWRSESWTEPCDGDELCREFAGWHPIVTQLVDRITRQTCYKWALFDRPPLHRFAQGRVGLLGDACHPLLPFFAQGAAMAIEDGAILAQCLSAITPVEAALSRYEMLRRGRVEKVYRASRRNGWVFHLGGPLAWARDRVAGRAGQSLFDWLYEYDPCGETIGRRPGA